MEAKTKSELDAGVALIKEYMVAPPNKRAPLASSHPAVSSNSSSPAPIATSLPIQTAYSTVISPEGVTFHQEQVFVGLDEPLPGFDIRNEILGPGDAYIRHIGDTTQARVWLCGRGSVREYAMS